ncbi:benzoate/H(+) symporter BenE family transporter [Pseudomonas putida]|uniref:benzoate/H(+) symporter BenE family transporter n=1 Tax=Pseudomonas putida group TaxID=136845 RepID=UPI0030B97ADA
MHSAPANGVVRCRRVNLAAIAAICTGIEAHDNPGKRYVAVIACAVLHILVGTLQAAPGGLQRIP